MSTHFSIGLGLIIACGVHALIFFKIEINQEVITFKKEQTLTVVLNKIPEKKSIIDMPAVQPSVMEKTESVEIPAQPLTLPSSLVKKATQKQKVKKTKPKKMNAQTPKQKIEQERSPESLSSNAPFESSSQTSTAVSQAPIQEIDYKKNPSKTISNITESFCPKPQYPFVAKQRNIEGRVKLALKIDENGAVIDAKILASEPEEMFEEAAYDAVMQCRNLPEQLFNSTVEQIIYFKLKTDED
jgi:TonB family protein